jgi:ankyrin repeat protein
MLLDSEAEVNACRIILEDVLWDKVCVPTHPAVDFRSALHWSVLYEDMTTLSLLLQHPQTIVDRESGRGNPYTEAASLGLIDVLRVLIAHHPGGVHTIDSRAPIHAAACYTGENAMEIMELLMEHNVDPNAQGSKGNTALYLALISRGYIPTTFTP